MPARSRFLARLIGIFSLVLAIAMTAHKATIVALAGEIVLSPPILLFLGLIGLFGGLAIVLAHNRWSGGPAVVLVTAIGWLLVVRGVVMVLISPDGALALHEAIQFPRLFFGYVAILAIVGGYLALSGFLAVEKRGGDPRR